MQNDFLICLPNLFSLLSIYSTINSIFKILFWNISCNKRSMVYNLVVLSKICIYFFQGNINYTIANVFTKHPILAMPSSVGYSQPSHRPLTSTSNPRINFYFKNLYNW